MITICNEKIKPISMNAHVEIFVYGTLMKGERNHYFLSDAEYLGEDAIADAELFDLGSYPMFVTGKGIVYGERYRIPLKTVPILDKLEEHPHYYRRRWMNLKSGQKALVYEGKQAIIEGYPRIVSGQWRNR